ncbi:MAG: ABC transporter ATP-binding protein, partial [Deltaproteobacteria bacterium]|nr:ABC transporter ATP-binding protein [Deltaproteobacteria bacterium]
GPSGSGKSTLLSILGCLDRPTQGSYRLDGDEVGSLDEPQLSEIRRWKIGFVFQSFHLVPRLEAAENVALPMVLAGIPAAERRERVAKALDAVGLAKRASHRPAELSGGECQRVAIARSMVMQPRLLLADEPTGNLDSKSGASVMELIEGMNANGLTLIVVTHDANIGRRANNVVVLRDGEIDQLVPGSELHYGLELANPREPAG